MPENSRMFWKVRATRAFQAMRWPGRRSSRNVGPFAWLQRDHALGRLVEAGDAVEDGGLAGAVRADDGGDVAAAGLEGEVGDRDEAAEAHGQVLDRQDRVGEPAHQPCPSLTSAPAIAFPLLQDHRRLAGGDEAARAPHHHGHHAEAEDEEAVLVRVEALAEDVLAEFEVAQELRPADERDGGDRDAELRAHAAEHDDREDDRRFEEVEALGLTKPCRTAKNEPAKPPNMAPIAKAVSLVLTVLMPSERQAISSSRSASQARPTGSLRSRRVTKLVISARTRIR